MTRGVHFGRSLVDNDMFVVAMLELKCLRYGLRRTVLDAVIVHAETCPRLQGAS